MITIEDVYKAAGLQDRYDFALKQMRKNLSRQKTEMYGSKASVKEVHRYTGRTTVEAAELIAAAKNKIDMMSVVYSKYQASHQLAEVLMDRIVHLVDLMGLPWQKTSNMHMIISGSAAIKVMV